MFIKDINESYVKELPIRVRAIMGVPAELLEDNVILSPTFLIQAGSFINSRLAEYETDYEEQLSNYNYYFEISYIYYVCYLLCAGMYSRLPKQMENVSTKTVLQTTDWDKMALDFLDKANEMLDKAIEELTGEEESLGTTMAILSEESTYPNTINM